MMLGLTILSLIIWLYMTFFHHGFWRRREFLPDSIAVTYKKRPSVISLTPARNEAALISESVSSVLSQSYNGSFQSVLIDDSSHDDTSDIARKAAEDLEKSDSLTIIQAPELVKGWSGKLWALQTGLDHINGYESLPNYYWLSDADIYHDPQTLARLVQQAEEKDASLVSLMVTLNCKGLWEKLIIPAFIYYFQMLYPFQAVNRPKSAHAGAAGGCVLIKREALDAIGGFHAIKDKLIDDCELGKAVKNKGYNIWLGHGIDSISLRGSSGLSDLWKMVTRTAFVQLNYSYIYLFCAILGMFIMYGVPVIACLYGALTSQWILAGLGAAAWGLMALTYSPTLKAYKRRKIEALLMPMTAHLFMAMTLQAAWLHFRGSHSGWHDRVYAD